MHVFSFIPDRLLLSRKYCELIHYAGGSCLLSSFLYYFSFTAPAVPARTRVEQRLQPAANQSVFCCVFGGRESCQAIAHRKIMRFKKKGTLIFCNNIVSQRKRKQRFIFIFSGQDQRCERSSRFQKTSSSRMCPTPICDGETAAVRSHHRQKTRSQDHDSLNTL